MRNGYFKFKQFTVNHDRCAMKVGTDGVLLGAWAGYEGAGHILDIGTGSGLVALQMAQRFPKAEIEGIEIDEMAAEQAKENVENSPWNKRIRIIHTDYKQFAPEQKYDLILSNPPFFVNGLHCPDMQRKQARHADDFDFKQFFQKAFLWLNDTGKLTIIFPASGKDEIASIAQQQGLYLTEQLTIYPKPDSQPNRTILVFEKRKKTFTEYTLVIRLTDKVFTDDYVKLTKDFYLKM